MATGSSGSARKRRAKAGPHVELLRIGHRPGRDPRLTTHLALTARAFGADRMRLHPFDPAVAEALGKVRARWGGSFEVVPTGSWKEVVRAAQGPVVHLTMYGEELDRVLPRLTGARSVLLVVGGAKVPSELYGLSTYNVAVGSQPHSEVAAVAVILDRLRGIPGSGTFRGGTLRIVPSRRGKDVRGRRARSGGA